MRCRLHFDIQSCLKVILSWQFALYMIYFQIDGRYTKNQTNPSFFSLFAFSYSSSFPFRQMCVARNIFIFTHTYMIKKNWNSVLMMKILYSIHNTYILLDDLTAGYPYKVYSITSCRVRLVDRYTSSFFLKNWVV